MKAKKIIPLVILTLIMLGIAGIKIYSIYARENNNEQIKNSDITNDLNSVENDSNDVEEPSIDETVITNDENLETKEDENLQDSEKVEEEQKVEKDKTNTTTNKNQESNKTDNSAQKENSTNKEEDKTTMWEELGITEYEWENSPMLKWQKVTHDNLDSCREEGDKITQDPTSGYSGYWCYEVVSYSGRYLGYMLSLN